MYVFGQGVAKDYVEAAKWFREAEVREGGGWGILGGAVQYRIDVFGRPGRPCRSREGADLVPQIRGPGLPSCGIQHGVLYAAGMGVPRDPEQAVEWYRSGRIGASAGSGRA
jgi:uncharacterized protein